MIIKQGYHKLVVYQKARNLVFITYKITGSFPKEELYVLVPQMRRVGISILANIVEGYSKNSRLDFARFLDISIGSATELGLFLEISFDLKYVTKMEFEKCNDLLVEVKKLLYSFHKSLKGGLRSIRT